MSADSRESTRVTGQQIDLLVMGSSNHTGNFENGLMPRGYWSDDVWRACSAGFYNAGPHRKPREWM